MTQTERVVLAQWGDAAFPLDSPTGTYNVRYCATAMDAAREAETSLAPPPDRYLLQFWPSDGTNVDRVIREGSRYAAVRREQNV